MWTKIGAVALVVVVLSLAIPGQLSPLLAYAWEHRLLVGITALVSGVLSYLLGRQHAIEEAGEREKDQREASATRSRLGMTEP